MPIVEAAGTATATLTLDGSARADPGWFTVGEINVTRTQRLITRRVTHKVTVEDE